MLNFCAKTHDQCTDLRDRGFHFLGLRTDCAKVTYFFSGKGALASLEQVVDEGTVSSIARFFPLADFAERELYRDCGIKSLGNSNLIQDLPEE